MHKVKLFVFRHPGMRCDVSHDRRGVDEKTICLLRKMGQLRHISKLRELVFQVHDNVSLDCVLRHVIEMTDSIG